MCVTEVTSLINYSQKSGIETIVKLVMFPEPFSQRLIAIPHKTKYPPWGTVGALSHNKQPQLAINNSYLRKISLNVFLQQFLLVKGYFLNVEAPQMPHGVSIRVQN